jgi:hypothetical protein
LRTVYLILEFDNKRDGCVNDLATKGMGSKPLLKPPTTKPDGLKCVLVYTVTGSNRGGG